jgi:hypothetical protein
MSESELNPLMIQAVESVTAEMARAFDVIWSRPDAPALMEQFLAGRVAFTVDRGGVNILARPDGPPGDDDRPDQPPGMYLLAWDCRARQAATRRTAPARPGQAAPSG